MDPLLILLIGMAVVVGSVLWLRLHAFLALCAGAFVVGSLTPPESIEDNELRVRGAKVIVPLETGQFRVKAARGYAVQSGPYDLFRLEGTRLRFLESIDVTAVDSENSYVRVTLRAATQVRPGDRLVHHRDRRAASAAGKTALGTRIAQGFGETCAKIGILIAMAAIIGKCLLDSGAAERIVLSLRDALGDDKTPLAFSASGFIVGIPVFFDTVFYLLMPLARAMRQRTGKNYLLYVLSIVVGATMAHSLVPPTPGPLFVAGELDVNLGLMILAGCVVGSIAVSSGYLYALWANRRWEIPLRDEMTSPSSVSEADRRRPSLVLSLVPIVLPVVLLSAKTLLDMAGLDMAGSGSDSAWLIRIAPLVTFLGDKNIALAVSAVIALIMLVRYPAPNSNLSRAVQEALSSAGNIVLITAAGGAFGQVLRQTGIAPAIEQRFPLAEGGITLLLMAFAITAIVRVAQGSATVAMITSVGIVAPIVANVELAFNPVYIALAIGCGSKPVPWMNDSGFWVVTRMANLTESEALRTVSVALTVMGFVGLLATLSGAVLIPLVAR